MGTFYATCLIFIFVILGLIARVQWDTYFPETARFGGGAAMDAAESYFAADSAAALAQLTASGEKGGPDIRALTAASLLDIAIALIGDASEAMSWLMVTHYNFCWAHGSLRRQRHDGSWQKRSPAMAAGLSGHIWSVVELLYWRPTPSQRINSM